MANRRPIVSVDGRRRQLPAGDTLAGVPLALPVYTAEPLLLRVPLISETHIAVGLAAGGELAVQVVIDG